jgi:hypothetical protein
MKRYSQKDDAKTPRSLYNKDNGTSKSEKGEMTWIFKLTTRF